MHLVIEMRLGFEGGAHTADRIRTSRIQACLCSIVSKFKANLSNLVRHHLRMLKKKRGGG